MRRRHCLEPDVCCARTKATHCRRCAASATSKATTAKRGEALARTLQDPEKRQKHYDRGIGAWRRATTHEERAAVIRRGHETRRDRLLRLIGSEYMDLYRLCIRKDLGKPEALRIVREQKARDLAEVRAKFEKGARHDHR